MPTKQFEPLLYRELRKVEAKGIIDIASPLLQEETNYATNAFQRCQESAAKSVADEPLPILALYHHIIGMTDGIEVLVTQSCAVPTIPLLRSSFEALLSIEYILERDYHERAFSWLVCYVHNRLNQYEMLDSSSQKGKEFVATFSKDKVSKYMKLPLFPDLSKVIQNLESLLDNNNYQIAECEYQRIKSIRNRKPDWYSLFGGPGNLKDLANHLNWGAQYDILYRSWSSVTHADDLSGFLSQTKRGFPSFKPVRNNQDLKLFSAMASSFILHATFSLINKFRSGETKSVGKWYMTECRQAHLFLSSE